MHLWRDRTFRENILDAYLFEDIYQTQVLTDEWMEDYNYNRPHEALGGIEMLSLAKFNPSLSVCEQKGLSSAFRSYRSLGSKVTIAVIGQTSLILLTGKGVGPEIFFRVSPLRNYKEADMLSAANCILKK